MAQPPRPAPSGASSTDPERMPLPWLDDVGEAAWVVDALAPPGGTVASLVPAVFPSFVRVSVRVEDGAESHPDHLLRERVIAVLCAAQVETDRCTFGVCDVYGWTGGESVAVPLVAHEPVVDEVDDPALLRRLLRDAAATEPGPGATPFPHPMLETPLRSYMLYRGEVRDARLVEAAGAPRALPDLWWPDDRTWFVATDTDLGFAVVAGPRDLTSAVTNAPGLSVDAVGPTSPLA